MERKADLPRSNLGRPIGESNNLTTSSSSSSSLSVSPPDFLRHVNAVFKRHRLLGTAQSNYPRASRVLVPQTEPSKSSASTASIAAGSRLPQTVANRGAGRLLNAGFNQRKDSVAEGRANSPEDSSLTPPSITRTITNICEEDMSPFGVQQREDELLVDREKASLAASSSHLDDDSKKGQFSSFTSAGANFRSADARMTIDTRMDDISSYLHSLALTEGEGQYSDLASISDLDLKQHDLPKIEMPGTGGANVVEKRDELRHNLHYLDPMTRSTVAGSSCATTMSIHSGPTFQCTHAPLPGHTGFPTQMSSAVETTSGIPASVLPEGRETLVREGDGLGHHQQSLHVGEGTREKVVSRTANHLQSQVPSTSNSQPPQSSKAEKAPCKKKYDPDVFFKVNGKLYQKLGKIGSGGSSEVHKVITSDCTIYALKKIKLKGRDYPTAFGFCQEIEYLNKLKGKSNIIQLIDYEVIQNTYKRRNSDFSVFDQLPRKGEKVTDKILLQEVMNGSMTIKDGRIKDDQYIYMVLEYGEIDLAHMLSQKWKEVDSSSSKIDENWLRFYWQQMLEAVNTIHEERIVHSDLKPANFLLVRGALKLIDFGIAKAILSDTTNIQRDSQVGTLNYMSPEAFMWNEQDASGNTIKCGRPSDIWSLGCILYQMVYGKTPFAEYKTFWAKFKVITNKDHKISYDPGSNPLLIDLMKRCLAWERNERWRIPQLLQHPFLLPPVPRELPLPPLQNNKQYKFLLERVGVYWNEPEVIRLCSELSAVVANLERGHKD